MDISLFCLHFSLQLRTKRCTLLSTQLIYPSYCYRRRNKKRIFFASHFLISIIKGALGKHDLKADVNSH